MADTCEQQDKTLKRKYHEAFQDIFMYVLDENKAGDVRKRLDNTITCLERGLNDLILREIKVIDANANRAVSFSRASVGMDKYKEVYALGNIFEKGHAVLQSYLQSDVSKGDIFVPKDAKFRRALKILLEFVIAHEYAQEAEFLISKDEIEEWQWTLELAQHLFSKLAVNPKYKYDISRSYDETECPCPLHEAMDGEKSDTSFGCEKGWHGKIDILMADVPICPIKCEPDLTRPSSPLPSSSVSQVSDTDSSTGIEDKRNKFNDNDYSQIVSETITFSFLKNKGKTDQDVTLIPSIAINKTGVQSFFYDSVNDVLLQSCFVELFVSKGSRCSLSMNGIILIWLTLNHQLFCTGSLPEMRQSGFHKIVDLHRYKEEVKAPCHISQDLEQVCISDFCNQSHRLDAVRMNVKHSTITTVNLIQEDES